MFKKTKIWTFGLQAESSAWLFKSPLSGGGGRPYIVSAPLKAAQLVRLWHSLLTYLLNISMDAHGYCSHMSD